MPRVLVSGPVGGDLQGLFAAAAKACAKAPFAALFCVGDFLGGTAPALGDLGPAPLAMEPGKPADDGQKHPMMLAATAPLHDLSCTRVQSAS